MTHKLDATLLFSKQDSQYKNDLSAYFKVLIRDDIIRGISSNPVEDLHEEQLKETLHEVDIIFVLVSMNVLTSDCLGASAQRLLMKLHRTKRLTIVPILLRDCLPEADCFSHIPRLPSNQACIITDYCMALEKVYRNIFNDIRLLCVKRQADKNKLEQAWKEAQQKHRAKGYEQFNTDYPSSKYAAEAHKNAQLLQEEQLWQEARMKRSVRGYVDYLLKSERKTYFYEAAKRIATIEESPAENWKEVEACNQLELFYHYGNRFPYELNRGKAAYKINTFLQEDKKIQPLTAEKLSSNLLLFNALEELDASDTFALTTYLRHFERIKKDVGRLKTTLLERSIALVVLFALSAVALLYFYPASSGRQELAFWAGVATVVSFLALSSYFSLLAERQFAQRSFKRLGIFSVLLKISFLSKNDPAKLNLLKFVRLIEQQIAHIQRKQLWHYLLIDSTLSSKLDDNIEKKLGAVGTANWIDSGLLET